MHNHKPRVTPQRRVNPSGRTVWVARYPTPDGRRPSAGTYRHMREAQAAIDQAIEREWSTGPSRPDTLGTYAATWSARHPRSERTNDTNDHRISRVLDARVEGIRLRDWRLMDLRRRHALELVAHMLVEQGRSASGVQNILRSLSAMAEDAITDDVAEINPFRGVRVRATDPRCVKPARRVGVFTWEQMHTLAAAAGPYEAMVRVLSDCGLRLGELLALERRDWHDGVLEVRRTAHNGRVSWGTKTDHGAREPGRVVPVGPGLDALLRGLPPRIDSPLLFPTLRGRVWRERNYHRDVWAPARKASGIDATPQDFRHSHVSLLRAAGIDPADLAAVVGHSVETATAHYTHALGRSFDAIREAIG